MYAAIKILLLAALAAAQCHPLCRRFCNSSEACFGHACPSQLTLGQHAARIFNYSSVNIGWSMGVAPQQLVACSVLTYPNYLRFLNNASFVVSYQGPAIEWTCQQGKGRDSNGRGWVLVYTCMTPTCQLWNEESLELPVDRCAENCTTGSVQDGICQPGCNVPDCDYDGGDCIPRNTTASNSTNTTMNSSAVSPPASSNPEQSLSVSVSPPAAASDQCFHGCLSQWLGDGTCQDECNTSSCAFDNGDCIPAGAGCSHNPCRNGGTCTSSAGSYAYACSCPATHCGPDCEIAVWSSSSSAKPSAGSTCEQSYNECAASYSSFKLCCYESFRNCSGGGKLASAGARQHLF